MRVVLLDIEGTTTPISFVYDVLFPYARKRMHAYVRAQIERPAFASIFEALQAESAQEHRADASAPSLHDAEPKEAFSDRVAEFALWLMDQDRKSTPLKEMQGQIWEAGYTSGEIQGVVYPDVLDAMKRWHNAGVRIAIYSSGSVHAQKLIFGYADLGDLRPWIDAYFDTTTGPKKEATSYTSIAQALDVPPHDILFLSDNPEELAAADAAGVHVRLAVRPGNAPVPDAAYPRIEKFTHEALGV